MGIGWFEAFHMVEAFNTLPTNLEKHEPYRTAARAG